MIFFQTADKLRRMKRLNVQSNFILNNYERAKNVQISSQLKLAAFVRISSMESF